MFSTPSNRSPSRKAVLFFVPINNSPKRVGFIFEHKTPNCVPVININDSLPTPR
jgi:hypothetical protein